LALWLAGALWSTRQLARSRMAAQALRRQSRPLADEPLLAAARAIARRLALRCPPILVSSHGRSPLLLDAWNPAVILPAGLTRGCSPAELRVMLAHELAHLKRGDLLWGWLPAAAHALFFFHPLVWLANREWRLAQEMACDSLAVQVTGTSVAEYGEMLVRIAAGRRRSARVPEPGLATFGGGESPQTLLRRLKAMKHTPTVSPRRPLLTGGALLLVGVAAVLPWRLTAQAATDRAPTSGILASALASDRGDASAALPVGPERRRAALRSPGAAPVAATPSARPGLTRAGQVLLRSLFAWAVAPAAAAEPPAPPSPADGPEQEPPNEPVPTQAEIDRQVEQLRAELKRQLPLIQRQVEEAFRQAAGQVDQIPEAKQALEAASAALKGQWPHIAQQAEAELTRLQEEAKQSPEKRREVAGKLKQLQQELPQLQARLEAGLRQLSQLQELGPQRQKALEEALKQVRQQLPEIQKQVAEHLRALQEKAANSPGSREQIEAALKQLQQHLPEVQTGLAEAVKTLAAQPAPTPEAQTAIQEVLKQIQAQWPQIQRQIEVALEQLRQLPPAITDGDDEEEAEDLDLDFDLDLDLDFDFDIDVDLDLDLDWILDLLELDR
jgi:beta-lactamase regulating signal transducer with metallopeptidase domain